MKVRDVAITLAASAYLAERLLSCIRAVKSVQSRRIQKKGDHEFLAGAVNIFAAITGKRSAAENATIGYNDSRGFESLPPQTEGKTVRLSPPDPIPMPTPKTVVTEEPAMPAASGQ